MRIVVAFAMDQEFGPWRRSHRFERQSPPKPPVFSVRLAGAEVRVVLTGIGPRSARNAMKTVLEGGADFCITTGLAGGLRSRHRSGDILAAQAVLDPSGVVLEKCDASLLRGAVSCGAREVEAFRSIERIVPTAAEKMRLAVSADAVEMESHVILAESRAAGVPAVAIRVVGDTAEQDLPLDFSRTLGASGRVNVPVVLAQLARHPLRIPAVARLGQQTQRAATRLASYLDRYIRFLATGSSSQEYLSEVAAG